MKITKENLQSEFENYKQYLKDDEMRQKVQDTFDLIEFYDEDEGVRKSVDAMVELANQWIEKNKPAEPKAEPETAQPQKTETKEDKQKKEPKTDETRPETKKEPEKPAKKTAKAEKKPKRPKQKFAVGDRVVSIATGEPGTVESIRWVDQTTISNNKSAFVGWAYTVQFDNGVNSDERGDDIKKEPKTKQPKTKQPKEKKEPEGEPMAKVSPEITIIKRFVKFGHSKKATTNSARLILVALQKMIVNKEIRKTSQYADDIMDIQKALLSIVKNGKVDFDRSKFERYEKLADTEYQEPIAKLSRSFIGLIGRTGVKDKAKNLLEKFEKAEVSGDLVDTMKKALKAYINGDTATIEAGARSLQGIFGLAGIEKKGHILNGNDDFQIGWIVYPERGIYKPIDEYCDLWNNYDVAKQCLIDELADDGLKLKRIWLDEYKHRYEFLAK